MMLKKLELVGFKSFAHRAEFLFEPGICALVGPNGSGKSNVADAVCWVLGEQSARALRGKKAEEVIFVGSAERRPMGMAEVALVLDNSLQRLPLEFIELRVARRLYRSGESEYLLNGARVRRKDIVDLLLQVGLHTEGYTVTGQGAVEELVLQRPEERRAVLEHAADITRHQGRVSETRAKLAAVEQNLTRSQDLIAELEPHSRRLRTQADRAERYAARRAELAALARSYYRAAMAESRATKEKAVATFTEAIATCGRLEAEIAAQESERLTQRQGLVAVDQGSNLLRISIEELHRARETSLSEQFTIRQRAGFLEARSETLAAELERAHARMSELTTEQASPEEDGIERGSIEGPDELLRIESVISDFGRQMSAARGGLEAARGVHAGLVQERDRLDRQIEADQENLAAKRLAAAEATAQLDVLRARQKAIIREIEELDGRLAELHSAEERASSELVAAEHRKQVAREQLRAARQREQLLSGELQVAHSGLAGFLEEITANGSEPDALRSLPRLGANLAAPAEYEPAIAAALSEWATAGVLPDSSLPNLAMEKTNGVRAHFILSNGTVRHAQQLADFRDKTSRALAGIWHRVAADFVQVSNESGTPSSLGPLTFTVLVRDFGDAIVASERLANSVSYPWQVVSTSGQLITYFGGLATGSEPSAAKLVGLRRREAETRSRIADLEAALTVGVGALKAAESQLAAAEAQEHESRMAKLSAGAERGALERRIQQLAGDHRRAEQALAQLEATSSRDQPTQSPGGPLARRSEISPLLSAAATEERAKADRLERIQAELQRAWAERERLREIFEHAAAQRHARQALREGRQRELQRLHADLERAQDESVQVSVELDQLRGEMAEQTDRASDLSHRLTDCGQKLSELTTSRADCTRVVEQVEARLAELRRGLSDAQSFRESALLRRQQAEDALARLRMEAEATAEEWGLVGEALVQLRLDGKDKTESAATHADQEEPVIDLESTRRRFTSAQRELRAQGPVGESVLQEYQEVQRRLDFLTTQSADLREAMQELEKVITELEVLMRQSFDQAFERVNSAFERTFATLFGGGTAKLALTDPADPLRSGVEIVAQPPGKRLQGLMSLSGGERALTSTALIFALLAINPLPFCVLDEVDAALDESNARRFAALLQEYSKRTQFIIITHNRVTMETARSLYGISMSGDGVTTVVSLRPHEALKHSRNGHAENGSQPVLQAR